MRGFKCELRIANCELIGDFLMSQLAIACNDVETAYHPSLKRPILNGIDCQIQQGEFVALLGLNGAGKSTLLRAFVGLIPLQGGKIHINGMAVTKRSRFLTRHHVGMLFQGGGLIRQLSAIDNVLCGRLGELSAWRTLWGFPRRDRHLALELLAQLGLQDLAYQKTSQLSGGQQQRVAIARCLIQSPQILLADEPITGLDAIASQQVMETLSQLHSQQGMTIVTVLHDLNLAAAYAERAIVLDAGRVVYDGSCENLPAQFSQVVGTRGEW
jgi:phosphonate transport system ATP-binding protein